MGLLRDKDKEQLTKILKDIENHVRLVVFTQEMECQYCATTRELAQEVAALSERVSVEVHDFVADAELAKSFGIDKVPAISVQGDEDYGIRFFGVPAGYEFAALVEDIVDVGRRNPRLPEDVAAELAKVDRPVHMQVMVSPTCPYCARAVRTAHRFALASKQITADMVEGTEFPHLIVKYNVQGVPKTIINETHEVLGVPPDMEFARKVLEAIGK